MSAFGFSVPKGIRGLLAFILVALAFLSIPETAEADGVDQSCHVFNPCDDGLSCHPFIQKCYHSPRRKGEPCMAGYSCGSGLTCEAGSHVCRAPSKVGESCHATRPCASGLNCQPGVHKCYNVPRQVNQPCSAGYGCAAGLTCEAGSQTCRAPSKVGESCHATRPCASGLSCQPGVHKCYNVPRQEGQPCVAGHSCGPGLMCEAGSQICRRPGREGESCHATRPCGDGLTCEAGSHKCRAPSKVGESCHATRPCEDGLSCHPGVHKCFHHPRQAGESCSAGYPCGDVNFECKPVIQKCLPKSFDTTSNATCSAFKSDDLSTAAKDANVVMSYGFGSSSAVVVSASVEEGTVYGPDGEFGCYVTACFGGQTDINIASYGAFGMYYEWDDFAGQSVIIPAGASFPIIEVGGFTTTQVLSTDGAYIGNVNSLAIGVGLVPVQVGGMTCFTNVLDGNEGISEIETALEEAKTKAEAAEGSTDYEELAEAAPLVSLSPGEQAVIPIAEISPPPDSQVAWKVLNNYWKRDHIIHLSGHLPKAVPANASDANAQWGLQPVEGKPDTVRLFNRGTPHWYLHAADRGLSISTSGVGATAEWKKVPAWDGYYRLQSVHYPDRHLNIETGRLDASPIQPGWHSALWLDTPAN